MLLEAGRLLEGASNRGGDLKDASQKRWRLKGGVYSKHYG